MDSMSAAASRDMPDKLKEVDMLSYAPERTVSKWHCLFVFDLSLHSYSFKMIYFYVCEIQPWERSDLSWGPDVRAFMFNLALDRLDHEDKTISNTLKKEISFVQDGPTYHFGDRFAIKLDYNVTLDNQEE